MEDGELSAIGALVVELDAPIDVEHPDVAVSDDKSGWVLSALQSGRVVWENPDTDDEPRHTHAVSRLQLSRIMYQLATGDLDEIESLDLVRDCQ